MASILGFIGCKRKAAVDTDAAASEDKPLRVTPGDATNMKRAMDEGLLELLVEDAGVKEDHSATDFKLLIMFVACVSALVAQFYPIPFPDNRWLLGGCFFVYFALSGLYQYHTWYVEKDYIFWSKKAKGSDAAAAAAAAAKPLAVRTQLPRFDEMYTVIVEQPQGTQIAKASSSVGAFFTAVSLPYLALELSWCLSCSSCSATCCTPRSLQAWLCGGSFYQ